jgi:membrane protein implicated in regulation of membrane protease activity
MVEVFSWLLLAAIFVVIEIITLGLTTIWFATGAFVAALAGAVGAPLCLQVILFLVVAVVMIVLIRPLATKHLNNKAEKTNVEAIIGKVGMVIETIDNVKETGRVQLEGMEWMARTKDASVVLEKDTKVRVLEVSGVKVIVEKVSE